MKKTLLTIAIALFGYCSYAQTNTFPSSGNVGIGTTNPDLPLNLYGTGDVGLAIESSINAPYLSLRKAGVNEWLLILERNTPAYGMSANDLGFLKAGAEIPSLIIKQSTGNMGIGTTSPSQKLVSVGSVLDIGATGSNNGIAYTSFTNGVYSALNSPTPTEGVGIWSDNQGNASIGALYDNTASSLNLTVRSSSSTHGLVALKVLGNGNIGIGTNAPDTKLAVNGTIHSKEVKVDLTDWPDYVFKPIYSLPSLKGVKSYIDKNQHLPDMPSEAEVKQNGINLGEIVKLQTKKIEELTLYLIQQKEESDKQNKIQQEEINELKSLVNQLIKRQ